METWVIYHRIDDWEQEIHEKDIHQKLTIMKKVITILLALIGCLNVNAQLGYWNRSGFVELTPDKSFIYKFVLAMDTESQKAIEDLLAGKMETEDLSIIKRKEGGWYVKNDNPLPEGNYYESAFYNSDSNAHYNELYIILPEISFHLKNEIQIDGLLEHLGCKVTYERERCRNLGGATIHYLSCQMKTSEEVLKTCKEIYDYGLESMKYLIPNHFLLETIGNGFLIKKLTGNYELSEPKLIYEMNWESVAYPLIDFGGDYPWKTTDEGIAITNPTLSEYPATYGIDVNYTYFSLEKGKNYIVRLTLKCPSDGTYRMTLGSWTTCFLCDIPIMASDDFQVINVGFPDFAGDIEQEPDFDECHATLWCGWVVGTTVVKKVEIYEINNSNAKETGITAVQADQKADNAIYNLAGQKVSSSYKGIVIRNGKKVVMK